MYPVDTKQRLSAIGAAIGITFGIVWSLSTYAYEAPPARPAWFVAKPAPLKACS